MMWEPKQMELDDIVVQVESIFIIGNNWNMLFQLLKIVYVTKKVILYNPLTWPVIYTQSLYY